MFGWMVAEVLRLVSAETAVMGASSIPVSLIRALLTPL